ncbi:putative N-acetyltransferase camello [Mustelus asterias]
MAKQRAFGEEQPSWLDSAPGFAVRPYRPEDYRDARRIVASGTMELVMVAFQRAMLSPSNLCLLLASTGTVYAATASLACTILTGLAFLTLVYLACRQVYAGYLRERMKSDMADIEGHYLRAPGAGFWVVEEVAGRVVATVGVKPDAPSSCQLLRLFVHQCSRRHGLGRRLTQEVLDFAKGHGYRLCLLETTNAHEPAIRLYQNMGFQLQSSYRPRSAPAALNFLSKILMCKLEKNL